MSIVFRAIRQHKDFVVAVSERVPLQVSLGSNNAYRQQKTTLSLLATRRHFTTTRYPLMAKALVIGADGSESSELVCIAIGARSCTTCICRTRLNPLRDKDGETDEVINLQRINRCLNLVFIAALTIALLKSYIAER